MATRFGTGEWAQALRDEINASSEYRNAAAAWGEGFNGNMLFAFEPGNGAADPLFLLLRLQTGACQGAEFVAGDRHPAAGFVLRAPFPLWREILERRTLAATAILTGRMKVEGERMVLLRNTAASRALIHCVASVETVWDGV